MFSGPRCQARVAPLGPVNCSTVDDLQYRDMKRSEAVEDRHPSISHHAFLVRAVWFRTARLHYAFHAFGRSLSGKKTEWMGLWVPTPIAACYCNTFCQGKARGYLCKVPVDMTILELRLLTYQ